jgi:hypothetical protein
LYLLEPRFPVSEVVSKREAVADNRISSLLREECKFNLPELFRILFQLFPKEPTRVTKNPTLDGKPYGLFLSKIPWY